MVGFICSMAFAANEFPLDKEQMGKLRHGLSEEAVERIIPGKPAAGQKNCRVLIGEYHQEWKYPVRGITLGMVSEKKGGLKTIDSVTIVSPSKLRT